MHALLNMATMAILSGAYSAAPNAGMQTLPCCFASSQLMICADCRGQADWCRRRSRRLHGAQVGPGYAW